MKDLTCKKPLTQIFALGKLNQQLQAYAKQEDGPEPEQISRLDKMLLMGYYVKQPVEGKHYKPKQSKLSVLSSKIARGQADKVTNYLSQESIDMMEGPDPSLLVRQ